MPTSLETLTLANGETLRVALAEFELAPTSVVREPAGTVFVTVPVNVLVTTDETTHDELGGITVPTGSVRLPPPTVTTGAPETQVVEAVDV